MDPVLIFIESISSLLSLTEEKVAAEHVAEAPNNLPAEPPQNLPIHT